VDKRRPVITGHEANAGRAAFLEALATGMGAAAIISYDGTANDDDALALGRLLVPDATSLALAYVRHAPEIDPERESLAQHDAERKLADGAALLGDPEIPRHVVLSASTGTVDPPTQIRTIAVLPVDEDDAAQQTASGLSQMFGAEVVEAVPPTADLIVVGSPRGVPVGRLVLSGAARGMLDASRGSVLVVPAGKPVLLQAV